MGSLLPAALTGLLLGLGAGLGSSLAAALTGRRLGPGAGTEAEPPVLSSAAPTAMAPAPRAGPPFPGGPSFSSSTRVT